MPKMMYSKAGKKSGMRKTGGKKMAKKMPKMKTTRKSRMSR